MNQISLNVDATAGPAVRVGDGVAAGDIIGSVSKTGQHARTPVQGVVKSIEFRPENHSFIVVITEKRNDPPTP